jgi:hypothetical protein
MAPARRPFEREGRRNLKKRITIKEEMQEGAVSKIWYSSNMDFPN